jgi:ribosomal-protein-alanine N-acetyltransferase
MVDGDHIFLRTQRLKLRDFVPEDQVVFCALPLAREYQMLYPPEQTTDTFYAELFGQILHSAKERPRLRCQLAICLAAGECVGTCGVRVESANEGQASLGYALERAHWGNGYALEAVQCLANFPFVQLAVHRLYAENLWQNMRSRALAEGLGMRLEAELQESRFFRGRYWDEVIYAVLAEEWKGA